MMHELIRCGYCDALLEDAHEEFAAHDAVCPKNPLVKRIAELEAKVLLNQHWFEQARSHLARIHELESQLAWTPVVHGLPTEHADYEFTYCDSEQVSHLDLVRLTQEGFELVLSGDTFVSEELLDNVDYTHYRRIDLPEAK